MTQIRHSITRAVIASAIALFSLIGVAGPAAAHYPTSTDYCSNAPDAVAYVYDFHHPCGHHDAAYRTHSVSRYTADSVFLREMNAHCTNRHAWYNTKRSACLSADGGYYLAFRAFGAGPYAGHSIWTSMKWW